MAAARGRRRRHPVASFALSVAVLCLLAVQVPRMSTGYDERAMQPNSTMSNQGYAAIARHYRSNELTADYLVIRSDHDLRNSAGFSALNAVSRAIQQVPGVEEVRSVTQPDGHPIPEFSLAHQDRIIADRMSTAISQLTASRPELARLTDGITRLDDGLGQISSGNALAAGSLQLANGIETAETAVNPILGLLDTIAPPPAGTACPPDSGCDTDAQLNLLAQDHSLVGQLRYTLIRLKTGSRQLADGNQRLADGARQLRDGLVRAATGSVSLADGQQLLTTKLGELSHGAVVAKAGTQQISDGVNRLASQMQTLVDGLTQAREFLAEVGTSVGDGPDGGFYVPKVAFSNPRLQQVMKYFLSSDGHTARVIVVNTTSAYSPEAIARLHDISAEAQHSLSRTSLAGSRIDATGLAAGFRDLHDMVMADFVLIGACALVFIFVILVGLLRSLLAPLYLVATIALSYAAARGLTVLIWQECFGIDIYWAVPPLAFVALVAVGSDYNMVFMSRIRAESATGLNTGILRAFKETGGVVSTAGVIFALTMLAMLASPTHNIGQVGFTIGAGLLLDTFLVRAITVPAIASLLGKGNWWPQRAPVSPRTDTAHNAGLAGLLADNSSGAGLDARRSAAGRSEGPTVAARQASRDRPARASAVGLHHRRRPRRRNAGRCAPGVAGARPERRRRRPSSGRPSSGRGRSCGERLQSRPRRTSRRGRSCGERRRSLLGDHRAGRRHHRPIRTRTLGPRRRATHGPQRPLTRLSSDTHRRSSTTRGAAGR